MIRVEKLVKRYPDGTQALHGVSADIPKGQFVAVIGPSGAGKSTFLRSINGLVRPSDGRVWVDGEEVTGASGAKLRRARRRIGMIFQQFNLVKRMSVIQNVCVGRLGYMSGWRRAVPLFTVRDMRLALDALQRVNIAEKALVRADSLSGGQQQRVAIARALAQDPQIMLADEPIASLDPETSIVVMQDLRRINRELGITTVASLHQLEYARAYADRVIAFKDGRIVFDGDPADLDQSAYERIYR
jgi:phosphonate transport system ATP-binding protein